MSLSTRTVRIAFSALVTAVLLLMAMSAMSAMSAMAGQASASVSAEIPPVPVSGSSLDGDQWS